MCLLIQANEEDTKTKYSLVQLKARSGQCHWLCGMDQLRVSNGMMITYLIESDVTSRLLARGYYLVLSVVNLR